MVFKFSSSMDMNVDNKFIPWSTSKLDEQKMQMYNLKVRVLFG